MGFFDFFRFFGGSKPAQGDSPAVKKRSGEGGAARSASAATKGAAASLRSASRARGAEPAASAAGEDRRIKQRKPLPPGTRVLIIDDSKTVVTVLKRMMRENNCITLEAYDAETAIEIIGVEKPDVIFLDIVLPGMNGFEALRRIRRMPEMAGVPVIMMSGNESATEQFYAERIGANEFMKKPFSRAEVFVRVERSLGLI
jgi:CheY-like chemotaxis protein